MNDIFTAVWEILGEAPARLAPLDAGNNDVYRVKTQDASYVLKCFEGARSGAYEREVGMRACLRNFTHIQFPEIVGRAALSGHRYILMEDVAGERLDEIWRRDRSRANQEMRALGSMLGSLHGVPVAEAEHFLDRETMLFSEGYFVWMRDTISAYVSGTEHPQLLRKCYEEVKRAAVAEVVIHGDFGPHQVIVNSQGKWILTDFEYAALGAFADDLAGTEVRLERQGYPSIETFLDGYERVRGTLTAYASVRSAFKAYNLLAMLTYRLAHKQEEPPPGELERLEKLCGLTSTNLRAAIL